MRMTLPRRTPWRTSGDGHRGPISRTRTPSREVGLTLDPHRLCCVQVMCFLSPGFLICTTGNVFLGSQAALGTKVPSRCSVNMGTSHSNSYWVSFPVL